jgi:hypothetical protein
MIAEKANICLSTTLYEMANTHRSTVLFISFVLIVVQLLAFQIYQQYNMDSTQGLPTTSCTIIERTHTNMQCFMRCSITPDARFLFSRDSGTGSCACCYLPLSGSVLNGSGWESFFKRESYWSTFYYNLQIIMPSDLKFIESFRSNCKQGEKMISYWKHFFKRNHWDVTYMYLQLMA